jgi:hypothetical protein
MQKLVKQQLAIVNLLGELNHNLENLAIALQGDCLQKTKQE